MLFSFLSSRLKFFKQNQAAHDLRQKMEYITLGRTGLRVSPMGLGCGGSSRIGQGTGRSVRKSVALVRQALDYGVNLIDTAEAYDTEQIVGTAIKGVRRESLVLSTKALMYHHDIRIAPEDLVKAVNQSLRQLDTDYIDIYHLHSVQERDYEYAVEALVPALHQLRDSGKIRFLGITETFVGDPGHAMLSRAVQDDCWDVVGVGFNMVNQSARDRVLAQTRQKNIGVLSMFAVREALSSVPKLREGLRRLAQLGAFDSKMLDETNPLGFLLDNHGAESITDAAYRYCRHEPGVHVVLFGTGNRDHLTENVQSLLRSPLPEMECKHLHHMFGKIDNFSGQW